MTYEQMLSWKYEEILREKLVIAWLSKGSITVSELDKMPINDRKVYLHELQRADDAKKKAIEEAREQVRQRQRFGKK